MAIVALLTMGNLAQAQSKAPKMNKQERVCLRNGNKLYEKKRYAEAEVEYRKALQANPASEKAQFNLATALMRQGSATAQQDDEKNPMNQAEGILTNLAKGAQDKQLRGKASYDLGNIAYGRQDYGKAVEFYKHALRCNPDDEQARYNLRLAQLKKQQQQGGMSQQNAEQVLKAMQDRERATQQRINAQQAQQQRHERQRTNRKW